MNQDKPGSLIGGILLIAGSCIGAGMLGLPILTGLAGFFPALVMFLAAWIFMTYTGLLLVEVNGWFKEEVNIVTMVGHTLGRTGKVLSWILYLFLFYALLVAYIAGSGGIVARLFHDGFSWNIPDWSGSLFFVLLFGWVVYLGTRPVDLWNRCLMVGKIACYLALVGLGIKYVKPALLLHTKASAALFALPLLITSFGFHNMIPSLTSYMKGDIQRVRMTILGGSLFAMLIYIIWEILVLGIVPEAVIAQTLKEGREASSALTQFLGTSWVSGSAQGLALFAILTSFLAQSLSLVHFLADGLKMPRRHQTKENPILCGIALLPPLAFSLIYPTIFFKALNFAGGICAVILFGIFPVLMVWLGRYRKEAPSNYQVSGGKPLLVAIFCFALFVFCFQLATMFGFS